ncbi:major capsid protein [Trichoplusia ni ascovirus 6b]|nr:major capsid protein [Trichoplusia ni ascovirus 6b]
MSGDPKIEATAVAKTKEDTNKVDIKAMRQFVEIKGGIENEIYNPENATTYFYREVRRSVPFIKVPEIIKPNGSVNFGGQCQFNIPRCGDYLLNLTLYIEIPKIELNITETAAVPGGAAASLHRVGWVKNLAHQLVKEIKLNIDDTTVVNIDTAFLDMWSEFMTDNGKFDGYKEMIGGSKELWDLDDKVAGAGTIILPLPLFFSRDSGLALPLSSLISSDISVEVLLRKWDEVLLLEDINNSKNKVIKADDIKDGEPKLTSIKLIGTYAVASKYEVNKTRCDDRRMLIEKPFKASEYELPVFDSGKLDEPIPINMEKINGAIKALFFAVKNTSRSNEHSVYKVGLPIPGTLRIDGGSLHALSEIGINLAEHVFVPSLPIEYYSYQQPYEHAKRIPNNRDLFMYSFCLDVGDVDPMGSINPKLLAKRLTFQIKPTKDLAEATKNKQTFKFITYALCNRLVSIRQGKFTLLSQSMYGEDE